MLKNTSVPQSVYRASEGSSMQHNQAEIEALFPDLIKKHGTMAYPEAKAHEARLLSLAIAGGEQVVY